MDKQAHIADEEMFRREPSISRTKRAVAEALVSKKQALSNAKELLRQKLLNRDKNTASLIALNKGAESNLFSARTVFPFVLFADTLKIDRQKLTIVHNDFMWVSRTASILLRDLRNIEADLGPFFGSITVTSQHFLNNTQTISFLRRADAVEAQRLLQGFMIAHEAQIDTDHINHQELLKLLDKLGRENI